MDRKISRVKTTCTTVAAVMAVCKEFISAIEDALNGRPITAGPAEPPSPAAAAIADWANAELNARHCAHLAAGVNVEVRLDNARPDISGKFVGKQIPTALTLWAAGQNCRHFMATFALSEDGRPESAVVEWTAYEENMTNSDNEFVTSALYQALDDAREEVVVRVGLPAGDAVYPDDEPSMTPYGYGARY